MARTSSEAVPLQPGDMIAEPDVTAITPGIATIDWPIGSVTISQPENAAPTVTFNVDEDDTFTCSICDSFGEETVNEPCKYNDHYETSHCIDHCDCYKCTSCDGCFGIDGIFGCPSCDHCGDCGCSCDDHDDYCHEPSESSEFTLTPPWELRGVTILHADISENKAGYGSKTAMMNHQLVNVEYLDACKAWDIDFTVDICQAMADFYLLDGIAGCIFNGVTGDPDCELYAQEARQMHRELVDYLDHQFCAYVDMVVGGELRHHPSMANKGRVSGSRPVAWMEWKHIRDTVGVQALADAAEMFYEYKKVGGGGIGGPRWAQAAEMLHARLTGKLDKRTWVDRVFTMQHNGGSLLNKIFWDVHNQPGFTLEDVQLVIGPAHAANPPGYGVLLSACTGKVRWLFSQQWKAANKARRQLTWPITEVPTPNTDVIGREGGRKMWRIGREDAEYFYAHAKRADISDWGRDPGLYPAPSGISVNGWALANALMLTRRPDEDMLASSTNLRITFQDGPAKLNARAINVRNNSWQVSFSHASIISMRRWAAALMLLAEHHQLDIPDTSELDDVMAFVLFRQWAMGGHEVGYQTLKERHNRFNDWRYQHAYATTDATYPQVPSKPTVATGAEPSLAIIDEWVAVPKPGSVNDYVMQYTASAETFKTAYKGTWTLNTNKEIQ